MEQESKIMYYRDKDKLMRGFQELPLFTANEGTWVGDIVVLNILNKPEICER